MRTDCGDPAETTKMISNMCEDKSECEVKVDEDIFAHVDCPDTSKYLEVQWKCKQTHNSGRRLPNLEQNVSILWNSRDKTLSTQDLQQALESVRLQVKSNIPKEPTALNMHILRNDTILRTQTEIGNGLGPSPM